MRLIYFVQPALFCFCTPLLCLHHAIYAYDDKGDAEKLTHVEKHSSFKLHLLKFEELNEEAESEDCGEAIAKVEASADSNSGSGCLPLSIAPLAIDDDAYNENEQVGKSLI